MTAPVRVARLPPRRRRRLGLVVLVVLFALLLLLSNLVPLAAEWLWFQALGYERVFTTRLVAEAVLGVGVATGWTMSYLVDVPFCWTHHRFYQLRHIVECADMSAVREWETAIQQRRPHEARAAEWRSPILGPRTYPRIPRCV